MTGGDLVDDQFKSYFKISFDSKNYDSLLQILQATLCLKKFKINRGSFIS